MQSILLASLLSLAVSPLSPNIPEPVSAAAAADPAPVDRLKEAWWRERHAAILAALAKHPDPQVVLIGDSITNNYDKADPPHEDFQPVWNRFYAPRGALNLGFSGDTTANLLWRLRHGEVAGIRPKVAVLLIGTNDTGVGRRTADQTVRGIDAVVRELAQRLPDTRILLLGLLPSALSPEKSAADAQVNASLAARYGEDARVTYLDIGSVFRDADGTLDTGIFYDPRFQPPAPALHPDTVGQRRMAEAIEPTLARLIGDAPRVPLDATTDVNTAVLPVAKLEQDSYDWFERHHAELALAQRVRPRIVLIGDSITHFWAGEPKAARVSGAPAWQRAFGDTPTINLGFGWDRTQNVLWRMRQGEFQGMAPDWVVLNIGTNNLTGTDNARASTPAEVVRGIEAILATVRQRSPRSRIALMAIFPRGDAPTDPLRLAIAETNRLLAARFAGDPTLRYLDIGQRFLKPDGTLDRALLPDGTHPNEAGYEIWADALIQAGVAAR